MERQPPKFRAGETASGRARSSRPESRRTALRMRRASVDEQLHRLTAFIDSALDEETDLPSECLAFVRAGKRLRAKLVLASSDQGLAMSDGDVIQAAAMIELVHAASLLHDDIVDQCDERRSRPTLHRTHGTEAATLAGTHLVHLALRLVADLPDLARVRIAEAGQQLARGQLLELMHARDFTVSPEERLTVMKLKTASMFGLACELGGTLAGEDYNRSASRRRFGEAPPQTAHPTFGQNVCTAARTARQS